MKNENGKVIRVTIALIHLISSFTGLQYKLC